MVLGTELKNYIANKLQTTDASNNEKITITNWIEDAAETIVTDCDGVTLSEMEVCEMVNTELDYLIERATTYKGDCVDIIGMFNYKVSDQHIISKVEDAYDLAQVQLYAVQNLYSRVVQEAVTYIVDFFNMLEK